MNIATSSLSQPARARNLNVTTTNPSPRPLQAAAARLCTLAQKQGGPAARHYRRNAPVYSDTNAGGCAHAAHACGTGCHTRRMKTCNCGHQCRRAAHAGAARRHHTVWEHLPAKPECTALQYHCSPPCPLIPTCPWPQAPHTCFACMRLLPPTGFMPPPQLVRSRRIAASGVRQSSCAQLFGRAEGASAAAWGCQAHL